MQHYTAAYRRPMRTEHVQKEQAHDTSHATVLGHWHIAKTIKPTLLLLLLLQQHMEFTSDLLQLRRDACFVAAQAAAAAAAAMPHLPTAELVV
jgi:hypothetical protein